MASPPRRDRPHHPRDRRAAGNSEEGWTAKDAVVHLGTWMARGATMLRQIAAGTYREARSTSMPRTPDSWRPCANGALLETVHLQAAAAHGELLSAWMQPPEVDAEGRVLGQQGRTGALRRASAAPGAARLAEAGIPPQPESSGADHGPRVARARDEAASVAHPLKLRRLPTADHLDGDPIVRCLRSAVDPYPC